jgi:plastocyanin
MKNIFLGCFAILSSLFSLSDLSAQTGYCEGADITIEASSFQFTPSDLVIEVGTTVGWLNMGGNHDVNGVANTLTGNSFNNPESFYIEAVFGSDEGVCIGTHTFTSVGWYSYDCTIYGHAAQGMVADLLVQYLNPGCTDSTACNYDASADADDNSCLYPEIGYDCGGNCLQDLDEDGICDACLDFIYLIVDCECEFFDPATYTVFYIDVDEAECLITDACYCACIIDTDGDGVCDENEVLGCSEEGACNFNPEATEIDDTCEFQGDPCDDNDQYTMNDVIGDDCICQGEVDGVSESQIVTTLVYPNPTSSSINVKLSASQFNEVKGLSLYNAEGGIVLSVEIKSQATHINATELSAGIYFLEIGSESHRIVIE